MDNVQWPAPRRGLSLKAGESEQTAAIFRRSTNPEDEPWVRAAACAAAAAGNALISSLKQFDSEWPLRFVSSNWSGSISNPRVTFMSQAFSAPHFAL
jgi:hypothetical protein